MDQDAFQRPVSTEQIEAMCHRAFGAGTRVVRVAEIGVGTYMADWTIHRVRQAPDAEAFWDTYGRQATSVVREQFYRARNLVGVRLDIHRRGIDLATVPPVHWDLGEVLSHLGPMAGDGSRTAPGEPHRPNLV